jgi:hypothetical protein
MKSMKSMKLTLFLLPFVLADTSILPGNNLQKRNWLTQALGYTDEVMDSTRMAIHGLDEQTAKDIAKAMKNQKSRMKKPPVLVGTVGEGRQAFSGDPKKIKEAQDAVAAHDGALQNKVAGQADPIPMWETTSNGKKVPWGSSAITATVVSDIETVRKLFKTNREGYSNWLNSLSDADYKNQMFDFIHKKEAGLFYDSIRMRSPSKELHADLVKEILITKSFHIKVDFTEFSSVIAMQPNFAAQLRSSLRPTQNVAGEATQDLALMAIREGNNDFLADILAANRNGINQGTLAKAIVQADLPDTTRMALLSTALGEEAMRRVMRKQLGVIVP